MCVKHPVSIYNLSSFSVYEDNLSLYIYRYYRYYRYLCVLVCVSTCTCVRACRGGGRHQAWCVAAVRACVPVCLIHCLSIHVLFVKVDTYCVMHGPFNRHKIHELYFSSSHHLQRATLKVQFHTPYEVFVRVLNHRIRQ